MRPNASPRNSAPAGLSGASADAGSATSLRWMFDIASRVWLRRRCRCVNRRRTRPTASARPRRRRPCRAARFAGRVRAPGLARRHLRSAGHDEWRVAAPFQIRCGNERRQIVGGPDGEADEADVRNLREDVRDVAMQAAKVAVQIRRRYSPLQGKTFENLGMFRQQRATVVERPDQLQKTNGKSGMSFTKASASAPV